MSEEKGKYIVGPGDVRTTADGMAIMSDRAIAAVAEELAKDCGENRWLLVYALVSAIKPECIVRVVEQAGAAAYGEGFGSKEWCKKRGCCV